MNREIRNKFDKLDDAIPLETLDGVSGGTRVFSTDDGGWSDPDLGVHAGASGSTGDSNLGASGSAHAGDGVSGHAGNGSVSGAAGPRQRLRRGSCAFRSGQRGCVR
ncbi:MAG: hypothetical protein HPM95_00830 [Alphaproteobacteria bacterium]|nr:hypothetical protein [Alphaproteobacteria bacterium]